MTTKPPKIIDLGLDAGDVSFQANGARVDISTEGAVTVHPANDNAKPPKPAFGPAPLEIGQMVEGKGIYVGVWEPKDEDGKSLGQIFDLYAAPEDLTDAHDVKLVSTYNESVEALKNKKDWHGHDGEHFDNSEAFKEALLNGTYRGGWVMPPKEILYGRDARGNEVQADNLYDHKDKGDLKGTFTDKRGSGYAHWYWSSTEHPDNSSLVYNVDFTDGDDDWDHKDVYKLSTRPVWVELRPS